MLAWLAVVWERFWPLVLPLVCVISVFFAVSWLGLWPSVSNQARLVILGIFALLTGAALFPLRKFQLPKAAEIDTRIERISKLPHRPVTAQVDQQSPVTGGSTNKDPFSNALWAEHQRRMAERLSNLKTGIPVPKIAAHDPFAFRALVPLLLFIGVLAGWGNWSTRIAEAFQSHDASSKIAGRIDAWVTPPAYTNRPPIFLSRLENSADSPTKIITVPEGSELVVRVLGLENPTLTILQNGLQKEQIVPASAPDKDATKATPAKSQTFKFKLQSSSSARLFTGIEDKDKKQAGNWSFNILPDANPTIAYEDPPKPSNRGTLQFSYSLTDDYGVASAIAEIKSTKAGAKNAEPLIKAPEISLPLPRRRAKKGTSKTSHDLTAHPWAGAKVTMTLIALDEAGQKGKSETKSFILPERIFTKPLALAIVEERRNLAMDAKAAPKVAEMLDIITTTHPEEFIPDKTTYMALRVAYRTIRRTKDKDTLREAVDLLWDIALSVEDGDLSRAERRLRDAQERLSKALENGASDEEIAELMKELRQAMNEFMQELREQMARNQQNQQNMPGDPNLQTLRQQDLDRMMKQIEDLAKSGSRDAARKLLEEMQRMMNNLQAGQPNQQQQQQQSDKFSEEMNRLGEMMRQQQQLMDQTFDMQKRQPGQQKPPNQQNQQGQNQQDPNQQGQGQQGGKEPMTAQEFADAMKELQQQQGDLQKQMQELQDGLKSLGIDPGEKLNEAGEAMGQAEKQLGQGQSGEATGEQGRALQAMREGAQQMMRNMQNQAGEQGRRGERGQHGQQSRQDNDPLGRQRRSQGPQLGQDTKVPGEIDAQRAREILDAIRRRLSDPARPKLELDYLDRLLPNR